MNSFKNCLVLCFLGLPIINPLFLFAQETNSQISGKIISEKAELLTGATVTAIHEPTKNTFVTQSRSDGFFHFFNLKPGGPYTIVASYTGFETIRKGNVFLHLNSSDYFFNLSNNDPVEFILKKKNITIQEVTVSGATNKIGIETEITNQMLHSMPSISRNLQDYIRMVPQAKVNGTGLMSLAGQNNKFNAFFIDGANNNDILGLAQSGTNGGQTNSPPISMDAIEQIKILLAPYDVQYSNFTGGSINAITRSGSNDVKASAWYYFRNEQLAGRSPLPIENPGSPGTFERPKLSHFLNQTAGVWTSGPIAKNKLFYFALFEKQSEVKPQLFNIAEYRGTSNLQQLNALTDRLRNFYQYEPGSFLETQDKLNATRLMLNLDWNSSAKNKFTLTYRYNMAERTAPATLSGSTLVNFQNFSSSLPTKTHSATIEWKKFFDHDISNRFLFTITNESDDRKWIGAPFSRVAITDGAATIVFGSAASSTISKFKAADISLSNIVKFIKHQHTLTTGIDFNFNRITDIIIPNYFGSYQFRNLNDFMMEAAPVRLQRSFSQVDVPNGDNTRAGAKYKTKRFGIFLSDEIRMNSKLKLNIGLRLDANSLPVHPEEDKFFNDTAINIISQYYNIEGARAGGIMKPHFQLAPRIGFTYKIPGNNIIIHGGGGIFTGHILNVWSSLLHQANGVSIGSIDINPQVYGLKFNPNPYGQPTPQSLGINPAYTKGELDLISKNFKYPTVFRSSLTALKRIEGNWTFSVEGILTKNIHETKYTNINLLPPAKRSSSPDERNIYSLVPTPAQIPLSPNGNPYTGQVYLLSNNHDKKGSSYSISFIINKILHNNFSFNAGYTYGKSMVLFEPALGNNTLSAQWGQTETVNGKNLATLSISDLNPDHRLYASLVKKINYAKRMTTNISLFYNGQSGSRYSYVYNGSMINDNGSRERFDLIYIATPAEIDATTFVPVTNTAGLVIYTPQQQKDFLNDFIQQDKYLRKHRGKFAERNGPKLPFTHIVDVRVQQDFKIKIKEKETGFSIIFDVFNFTNLLNKNWGRTYFMAGDRYPLITFAGYANTATITPKYQFTPLNGTPYSLQPGTLPGNSARWISQLGFRVNFN